MESWNQGNQGHQERLGGAGGDARPQPGPAKNSSSEAPPHNLEAERSVLGAILVANENLDKVREIGRAHV